MENQNNKEFNNLVEAYKKLSTKEKQDEIIKLFKENIAIWEKLNNDINNNHNLLLNREIIDINKENFTLDDFLEAIFVYLHMLSDSTASFAEKISNDFYK